MRIGTFNVRGISSETEKQNLIRDAMRYKCDVISLQETKTQSKDRFINGYRMILFDSICEQYGLGFIISPEVNKTLIRTWKVNDRIAVAKFKKNNESKHTIVINVYGPTSIITRNQKDKSRESLFRELNILSKEYKNDIIYFAGDFNSKLGKRKDKATETCLGLYSKGKRNENGEALLEFCLENNFFIANSAFKHKSCHITTWKGQFQDKQTGQTINVFNQIDYIIVQQRYKHHLINARSYAGTLVNSDHRLVIATSNTDCHIYPKISPPKIRTPKYDIKQLQDLKTKKKYQIECNTIIEENIDSTTSPKERQAIITSVIIRATNNSVPIIEPNKKNKTPCPIISKLSEEQKELRLRINNCNDDKKKSDLKTLRNSILHKIRHQALENASNRIDEITETIESTPDSHKMFQAVKFIRNKPSKPIVVHDDEGRTIENDEEKLNKIANYMREKYAGSEKLNPFTNKGPLQIPISSIEVKEAIKRLNNNRASGLDGIKAEHLKATCPVMIEEITDMFNSVFEQEENLDIGRGNLILLQKPNKPTGPIANLRPIVLLSTFRKLLSIITLNRIRSKIEHYLSPSQAGFRRFRSTSDIVFTHKWLIGRIQKYQEQYTILGIDMSSAFDTIDRGKLIKILETFLNSDDLKLIRIILADTELNINIGSHTQTINTIIGTPQGDSISPILFIVYLEGALRDLRPKLPPTKFSPRELIYADDVDLIFDTRDDAEKTLNTIIHTLGEWNLKVNASKTDFTYIEKAADEWKHTRKLGSLLGDLEDLGRRKTLAIVAFKNITSIFIRRHKISETRRMRLYNALILPILMYNSSTWALTETETKSINAFHRKQLRILLGIFYPEKISNHDLYIRCNTNTISSLITKQRWQLFGHILRRDENIPAQLAMDMFYKPGQKFRGRPKTNLPSILDKDIQLVMDLLPPEAIANDHTYSNSTRPTSCRQLKTEKDLSGIRNIARNRELWQELGHELVIRREATYASTLSN